MTTESTTGTALITGASAGIGAVYANRLAHRGYGLILVARDTARLDGLAVRLREQTGAKVDVLTADLATRDGVQIVVQRLRDDPAITMLVNNAGMAGVGTLTEMDSVVIDKMIQLNIVAVTHLAAAAAAGFVARRRGTIINIASVLALAPELFNGVYSGTKAFVLNLTQSLQNEVASHGVRVQAVLPGGTRTEIWERSGIDIAHIPAEMLMGVDEMVDAALAGLDIGETITIPALPDFAEFEAFSAARLKMTPNLSRDHAAARYKAAAGVAP